MAAERARDLVRSRLEASGPNQLWVADHPYLPTIVERRDRRVTLPGMAATLTLADVDLLDHDLFADHEPWEIFELLQSEAPVFRHPEPDGPGFWCVTKYDDVLDVLRDTATFSSEVGGAATINDLPEDVLDARRNFMETDPPRHTQFRRIFAADFTPRAVGRYEDWLRDIVREVLDDALRHGELEAVHEIAAPIPIRVLARILGLKDEHLSAAGRARRPAAHRHGAGVRRRARVPGRARRGQLPALRKPLGRGALPAGTRVLRGAARASTR